MERFTLGTENNEYDDGIPDPVLRSQEILEHKTQTLEGQSLYQTVVETDGLTPLLQLIVSHALPLI